ncbi:hypothetical protein Tco_1152376, partial [Tanacetum coccineum]
LCINCICRCSCFVPTIILEDGEQVETPDNLFIVPANIHTIEAFMNRVGYQGVIDKVSAFFTKNLAQPWQNMFKIFNRCLKTRTSGYDQTKINILQLFHAVINQTNVDYDALLWWVFMNNVLQKKEAIQIEPESHKENPKFVDDGDDKAEEKQNDDMGILEIRNEEMQTTIPTPPSSPRKILSSNKKID